MFISTMSTSPIDTKGEGAKMGSLSSLSHLRFEVTVAEAHAARRPDSQVAVLRLAEARAALAERRVALAGRYLTAADERDAARDELARRVHPATPSQELALWALSRHRTAAVVAKALRHQLTGW
jgi:hypothetical protein